MFPLHVTFQIVCLLLCCGLFTFGKVQNANSYIAQYTGSEEDLVTLLSRYGYIFHVKICSTYYKFIQSSPNKDSTKTEITFTELKKKDGKLLSFYQEQLFFRQKRTKTTRRSKRAVTITDSEWSQQWNLNQTLTPSLGVYNVWNKGFNGSGVVVAVVDDGIDTNHIDLVDNFDPTISYDILQNVSDASHKNPTEGQGTHCAGVIAAGKNNECIIGIAHACSLAAIRIIADGEEVTASDEAMALTYKLDVIDIYSNSWGPIDDGIGFDTTDSIAGVQEAALIEGVTTGRGGKGAIYVWAAGNGGGKFDDCNVDGYSNSMYTISINALSPDTSPAWSSEECTAVLAATYGGDENETGLTTTERNGQCTDDFGGTSAACPVAAGILALVLQSNPDLTWRDMQHLIVENTTTSGLADANFITNGAGKKVSLSHGFGLLNAETLVDAALSLLPVPKQISCNEATQNSQSFTTSTESLEVVHRVDDCFIGFLEHVLVTVRFKVLFREETSIYIVSPMGTESRILRKRLLDIESNIVEWTFMSVHTWGEKPIGEWTLRLDSSSMYNAMYLYHWRLDFYGTVSNPVLGTPNDGEIGGSCNSTDQCSGASSLCLEKHNVCIDCSNGFHIINETCKRDGTIGGYCDDAVSCISSDAGCNASSNICTICPSGYYIIDGFCIQGHETSDAIEGYIVCGILAVAAVIAVSFLVYKPLKRKISSWSCIKTLPSKSLSKS